MVGLRFAARTISLQAWAFNYNIVLISWKYMENICFMIFGILLYGYTLIFN